MRKRKMLIGVLTAAMLLGNVSPAMVQGAQAADVTEVPAETETEELATESAVTEVEETTETAVTETEENQPSEIAATEANEERLTEELATEVVPTETEEAATEIEVTETEEEETTEDAYKTADAKADKNGFIIEDGVLTGYTGPGGDIVIPKGVTSIGNYAFEGSGLKSVVIPASVTSIEAGAFSDCDSMTSVVISASVTSIGDYAFERSGLKSIVIPASVTSIGDYAFKGTGLTNVVIPASVTDFGDYIFEDCDELQYVTFSNGITKVQVKEGGVGKWFSECKKLKKLIIPKSLENMDSRICERNESLEAIEIDSDNQAYQSIDGIVYDKSRTKVLYCPRGFKGGLVIPDGVTGIGEDAFGDCSKLENIRIPKSVTSIGTFAFIGCSKLETICIPKSVTSIGMAAFAGSGLKSVVIPGSVENIDAYTFEGCKKLKKVIIKDGVKTIGLFAFGDCTSLTDITIPASVTDIEFQFTHCKETPFNGCSNITVHCQKGSYVENYIYFYCYGLGYKVKTDLTGTNQIIIASNFTKTYGDAAFSIDAVTSGDGELSYVSDNESVAKVDAKGKVTLTGVGTAHITVTASETNNYSEAKKVITITVKKNDSDGNTDNNSNLITAKNITKTYGCKAFSIGAKSKSGGKLTYSVADKKVAAVDKKGKVTVKGYGQTKITITSAAKGKYPKSKKTITLTVKPVKTRIASVKSTKSKNMVVKWKKDTKATGYVIQYSTDKKFKKGVKTVTITKNKTTSKTIGKLKGGKNYYVRVCTYKKSNGKQIKGSYSAVKSIKVKK